VFSGCTNGETRLCPLQVGVCEGSFETCNSGLWSGCNYATIPGYEADEATCDELDNDCNGLVDDVDADGDGVSLCGGIGVVNELLIVGLNNNPANIDVLYYNIINNAYESIWSTTTSGISSNTPGGEIGDVTHDGINDFVISRNDGTLNTLEVWSYNQASVEWSRVWKGNIGGSSLAERIFIGDIDDFDNDGFNEILVTNGETEELELYGTDSYVLTSFAKQHSVKMCSGSAADYIATGADMNNNGVPEIVFQCGIGDNLEIFEWNGASFVLKAALPQSMFIDDAESGDVNQDGIDDVVFCGNDMRSHVLTYSDGNYVVGYATPKSSSFIQSCSVGDVTNDGHSDWFDVSQDGARVFSFNGNNYINTWSSSPETYIGAIGASFVGDCDNDGFTEFLHGPLSSPYNIKLWENDVVGATSFSNTFTFDNTDLFPTIVIGNLNPYNDDLGVDCNDYNASIHPGATEICGNGIDDNCNDQIDENCGCVENTTQLCPLQEGVCENAFQICIGGSWSECDYGIYYELIETSCDSMDNDCDGSTDEGLLTTYYEDFDVDTYGNLAVSTQACSQPSGYVTNGDDCNDYNASIHPGASEVCGNGIDDDCDDEIDEGCGETCGNGYCAGSALGEDCFSCPADCLCEGRSCSKACCGDGTCTTKYENVINCPVDC
jgi:hypothetical protein